MRQLFDKLIRRVVPSSKPSVGLTDVLLDVMSDVYDPAKDTDRVGLGLLVNVQKQLDLMGLVVGEVPFDDKFGSDKCRGALLGTTIAIVQAEITSPSHKDLIDATIATFSLVYGEAVGPRLALATLKDASSNKNEIATISDWAVEDTKGVYLSGGITSASAFYMAANNMI